MPTAVTTAWPALGTTVAYSLDGTAYTDIGQVTSVSNAGGGTVGKRDTTSLSSTGKSYAPTIPDPGELEFEINFDPSDAAHVQLRSWRDAPPTTLPWWKVTYATGTPNTDVFRGFVSNFDGANAGGVDENLTATVTVQVIGTPTHT